METLRIAKESFAATMEHEKAAISEQIQSEKTRLVHDFEIRKEELEIEMRKRQEEMDNSIVERETKFDEERERELNNISFLREIATREREELKLERIRIEKEKQEIRTNQNYLEGQQMRKDIDELVSLSSKLKGQREQFIKERECFIAFVEKHKNCETCGEITSEFVVSELQSLPQMNNDVEVIPLPALKGDYLEAAVFNTRTSSHIQNSELTPGVVNSASPDSSGAISWLKKYTTKIFSLSPGKRGELTCSEDVTNVALRVNAELPVRLLSNEDSFATNLSDVQKIQSEEEPSAQEIRNDSEISELKQIKQKTGGRNRLRGTRSMRAVVADVKSIIGEQNGNIGNSARMNNVEGHEAPSIVEKDKTKGTRKRARPQGSQNTVSEQDLDYSEGQSGGFATGGYRRRRVAQVVQPPGKSRYNLRQHKNLAKDVTNGALSDLSKGKEGNVEEGIETKGAASNAKATDTLSTEIASDNGGSTNFLEYEGAADGMYGNADASSKLVDNMVLSEEDVNRTPVRQSEASSDEVTDDDEEDDDDDEEESEHPGEVSIGKKFWNFLTT